MMVNPTKRQRELLDMFEKEILPFWTDFDVNEYPKLRDDAPEDIKKKYELFMKSGTDVK